MFPTKLRNSESRIQKARGWDCGAGELAISVIAAEQLEIAGKAAAVAVGYGRDHAPLVKRSNWDQFRYHAGQPWSLTPGVRPMTSAGC